MPIFERIYHQQALLLFLSCFALVCCAPVKYIEVFEHKSLAQKLSADQYQTEREQAYARCRLEALKIPLPDPFPLWGNPYPRGSLAYALEHEHQEIERARHALRFARVQDERAEVLTLCMKIAGWRQVKTLNPKWIKWQEKSQ